jgi:hypothetical protein
MERTQTITGNKNSFLSFPLGRWKRKGGSIGRAFIPSPLGRGEGKYVPPSGILYYSLSFVNKGKERRIPVGFGTVCLPSKSGYPL